MKQIFITCPDDGTCVECDDPRHRLKCCRTHCKQCREECVPSPAPAEYYIGDRSVNGWPIYQSGKRPLFYAVTLGDAERACDRLNAHKVYIVEHDSCDWTAPLKFPVE